MESWGASLRGDDLNKGANEEMNCQTKRNELACAIRGTRTKRRKITVELDDEESDEEDEQFVCSMT